jgi:hypothetical protein
MTWPTDHPSIHPVNLPTNQATNQTFLRFTASLISLTEVLNWDWAYTNEFPVAVEDLIVDKLRTIAQEAVSIYGEA